jgi:hypothetical protein
LQFRFPNATCECYGVQVDTYQSVHKTLIWRERVERTAEASTNDFADLCSNVAFLAAGREGFAKQFDCDHHRGARSRCFDVLCLVLTC